MILSSKQLDLQNLKILKFVHMFCLWTISYVYMCLSSGSAIDKLSCFGEVISSRDTFAMTKVFVISIVLVLNKLNGLELIKKTLRHSILRKSKFFFSKSKFVSMWKCRLRRKFDLSYQRWHGLECKTKMCKDW